MRGGEKEKDKERNQMLMGTFNHGRHLHKLL